MMASSWQIIHSWFLCVIVDLGYPPYPLQCTKNLELIIKLFNRTWQMPENESSKPFPQLFEFLETSMSFSKTWQRYRENDDFSYKQHEKEKRKITVVVSFNYQYVNYLACTSFSWKPCAARLSVSNKIYSFNACFLTDHFLYKYT